MNDLWPIWIVIGVIFFVIGVRHRKLKERVDALDMFIGNRVHCSEYQELKMEVNKIREELKILKLSIKIRTEE